MNTKQQRYILKAFLASDIPAAIREKAPELIALDSALGGYCTNWLRHKKSVMPEYQAVIAKEEKQLFSAFKDDVSGAEKDELILYYRLAILVELVLSTQHLGG